MLRRGLLGERKVSATADGDYQTVLYACESRRQSEPRLLHPPPEPERGEASQRPLWERRTPYKAARLPADRACTLGHSIFAPCAEPRSGNGGHDERPQPAGAYRAGYFPARAKT